MSKINRQAVTSADELRPGRVPGGEDDCLKMEDVSFIAQVDGTEQKYVLMRPGHLRPGDPRDVLIVLHGHGSDRWQFARDTRDECRAARDVAVEQGMLFVSPDYRAPMSWMGPQAEADLVQIIGDLKAKDQAARVFLCGGSMGGSSCLSFAVLHPELVDGVASMNGTANHLEFENYQEAIQQSFGGSKAAIPLEYKKRSAAYWPDKLSMPVGITAGGRDEQVPPHSVVRLAGILKTLGRDVLLIYREAEGHATRYEDARAVLEFVIHKAARAK